MSTATREERKRLLVGVLGQCGYGESLVQERFAVWSSVANVEVDLVAFARPDQRDISTSAVMAHVVDVEAEVRNRWLRIASDLAVPALLVALPDRLSLWTVSTSNEMTREVVSSSLSATSPVIDRLSTLTPEAVARAKAVGSQIPLFPLDLNLLEQSRKRFRTYLTDQVEGAMQSAAARLPSGREGVSSRLVIGALAVLMLRDKSQVSADTPATLVDIAQQRYPGYFDWLSALNVQDLDIFDELVTDLGSRVNFAGLEPAMVSDVYEQALVTQGQRRTQGTYYTPPALARQIFSVLPIEQIPPNERFVLDPACGSGTLLLAAAARLDQLQPFDAGHRARHRYLTSHLQGYDQDAFATEVTKLSLLMTALPVGNSWQVEAADVLTRSIGAERKPSVVVSNPPWEYSRQNSREGERANRFLEWMLANMAPNGLLACILPLSWLNSRTSRSMRENLLAQADLLEVWRLPESTFDQTSQAVAPAVIIAQKRVERSGDQRMTLVKRIGGRLDALPRFLETGLPDFAYLTKSGIGGEALLNGPLTRFFQGNEDFQQMQEAAIVRNGRPHKVGRPSRHPEEATHWELASLRHLPAFGVLDSDDLLPVKFPEDFDRSGRSDTLILQPKVIVTAKRWSARDPWRLKAGLDLVGVVPRESFHMVLPIQEWDGWGQLTGNGPLNALVAILGSALASCWVDEREPGRNVSPDVIRSFPIPKNRHSIRRLANAGARMVAAVTAQDAQRIQVEGEKLEAVVASVYNLPPAVRAVLVSRLGGEVGPEGGMRLPIPDQAFTSETGRGTANSVPSFGHVLAAKESGLRLWISGITDSDGQEIDVPIGAPGWLCRPGVDFVVRGNLDDLTRAEFQLHVYDWLPEGYYEEPEVQAAK